MSEIIFEVREDESDGGYTAAALGIASPPRATPWTNCAPTVQEAVRLHFDDGDAQAPKVIRLHFVRDEVLAR